jgi:hypothetical protein
VSAKPISRHFGLNTMIVVLTSLRERTTVAGTKTLSGKTRTLKPNPAPLETTIF